MNNRLSIILVTSPAPSNPSLFLVNKVLQSIDNYLLGLKNCPIIIVADGFKLDKENRTKKGRITEESKHRYEEFLENIGKAYADSSRYRLHRCLEHQGFAYAVKQGLELCTTEYALIAQHDRNFRIPFPYTETLLDAMDQHHGIRYIGFPTNANINHDILVKTQYNLDVLNTNYSYNLLSSASLRLQPLIFWYDSQHLCHVQRYLEIYRPYKNLSPEMRQEIGLPNIGKMLLKRGDFIEDKFGQVQRDLLYEKGQVSDALACQLFQWYGSYLCWWTATEDGVDSNNEDQIDLSEDDHSVGGSTSCERIKDSDNNAKQKVPERGRSGARSMVSHLRGRLFNPAKIAERKNAQEGIRSSEGEDTNPVES